MDGLGFMGESKIEISGFEGRHSHITIFICRRSEENPRTPKEKDGCQIPRRKNRGAKIRVLHASQEQPIAFMNRKNCTHFFDKFIKLVNIIQRKTTLLLE